MVGPTPCILLSSPKLVQGYIGLQGSTIANYPPVYLDQFISGGMKLPHGSYVAALNVRVLSVS